MGKTTKKKANNFVKVGYKKGVIAPLYMAFKRNGPIIKFVLRDSFRVEENKIVYEYYTKNFFGEAPGKHFDFGGTFGWSYNEYYIYIDISNTLFCKQVENYEVADASPIYKYFIDENGESFKCFGHYKIHDSQFSSKEEQYVKWVKYFVDKGHDACSKAELIPK